MKRGISFLLAGLLLLVLAIWLLRGPISLRLVRAGLERNMTADLVAELPDGLHVVLCGAGGPMPDPVRSGPCVAVIAGRRLFVVDAGTRGARNLAPMGVPIGRVEAVLLTHAHSDHIDGLGELALLRWVGAGHQEPLPVYGPPGSEEVVEGLNRSYRLDAGYRTAHHGPAVAPPTGAGMIARSFEEPEPGAAPVLLESEGLRISVFRVEHEPVKPAVGYRFDYAGRSVVISGDTRRSANVEANAQGVDLLVHEALSPQLVDLLGEVARSLGRDNIAKIAQDIPDYHTSPVEAAEIAARAGAGHLLFYHVVPPLPLPGLETVFLEGVADAYPGDFTLGRDGTLVSLPAGSEGIRVSQR